MLPSAAVLGQDANAELSRYFTSAQQAQTAGHFDVAIQNYQAVLRLAPGLPEAEANLGLVYHLQARYSESAKAFEKARAAKPGLSGVNLFLGIDYAKLGEAARAVPYLQRAVKEEPANKIARTWLSTALWDAGNETEAISQLRDAANTFPSDPDVLFLLGQALRNAANDEVARHHDSAAQEYRKQTLSVLSNLLAIAPESARTHQLNGQILAEHGNDEEALGEYRKAETATRGLVGLHFAIGELLWKMSKPDQAIPEFERELRLNPGYAEASAAEGSILVIQHQPDRAIPYLQKALQLKPSLVLAHRELGKAFEQRHEYVKAEREFTKALADDPGGEVHYLLGVTYKRLGKEAEAKTAFAEARRIKSERVEAGIKQGAASPQDSSVTLRAAQDDLRSGRTEQAIAKFRQLATIDQEHWANQYNLALALLATKQPTEAIRTLETLATKQPNNASVLDLLGMAYQAGSLPERALASYRDAVNADPANHDYYLDYTRLLIDLNRYDESERFIEDGLQRLSGDYALTMRLGSLQMMQGKFEQARGTFQRAIANNPEIALGYVALAQTYLRERRDADALSQLEAARAKLPEDAMIQHYYGLALVRLGKYTEAVTPLEHAARMNPDESETHYLLGKSYEALGRVDTARSEYEQAIRVDSSNAGAYYQLSRIYARTGDSTKAREMAERTRQINEARRQDGIKAEQERFRKLEPVSN